MGGYGLAALSGILGGLGTGAATGFDKGTSDVLDQQKMALAQQHLAEQQRQFDLSRLIDVGILPKNIQGQIPPGTGKIPVTTLPTMERAAEKTDAAAQAEKQRQQWAEFGTNPPTDVNQMLIKGAGLGPSAPQATLIKELAELGKPQPQTTTFREARGPNDTQNMVYALTHDKAGNVTGTKSTGLAGAESKSALNAALEGVGANPWQKLNVLAGQIPVAPGGSTVSKAGLGGLQPPGASGGISPTFQAPTLPNDAEVEKAGMRNAMVGQLENIAKQADTMPQLSDAKSRASLQVRAFIQGRTPFQTLSPEEQAWVTKHENLRTILINLETGLGSFRSPQMQAKFQEIMGQYWSPGTPERIRELAQMVREQGQGVAAAASTARRIPIPPPNAPAPTPAPMQAAPQEAPWTDLGNGMRIRQKR